MSKPRRKSPGNGLIANLLSGREALSVVPHKQLQT